MRLGADSSVYHYIKNFNEYVRAERWKNIPKLVRWNNGLDVVVKFYQQMLFVHLVHHSMGDLSRNNVLGFGNDRQGRFYEGFLRRE